MYAILDRLMFAAFVDVIPAVCMLLGTLLMLSGGIYVATHLFTFLLKYTTEVGLAGYRYVCWKFPRLVSKQPSKRLTVVNVGDDEFVVYLDGRFVGAEAVSVPVSLIQELGIEYTERRACMRWYKAEKGQMPDYLKDITLLNEGE